MSNTDAKKAKVVFLDKDQNKGNWAQCVRCDFYSQEENKCIAMSIDTEKYAACGFFSEKKETVA